jgi:hypothetical protein
MKNIMIIILGFFFLFGCTSVEKGQVSGNEFTVPSNYSFESENDFRRYEPNILECINYLKNAPVNDLSNNRKKINSFFMDWLTGVPYVHIKINSSVMELCKENSNFLIIFMAGWTEYALLNPNDKNEANGFLAGIETIIDVYKKGNGVKRDPNIQNLINIQNQGNLLNWVNERI